MRLDGLGTLAFIRRHKVTGLMPYKAASSSRVLVISFSCGIDNFSGIYDIAAANINKTVHTKKTVLKIQHLRGI